MKTKLLTLLMMMCLLSSLMLSGCFTDSSAINNEENTTNTTSHSVYTVIRDENVDLLNTYPTQIMFWGDGTGQYSRTDGSSIVFNYTIDATGYVETINTTIKSKGWSTPITPYDSSPNVSGYMEGNIYMLRDVPLRYEKTY